MALVLLFFKSISYPRFRLIIDEINRANLPSVLGELIYALEYRGEAVTTMYELEEDRQIILPKNLYIIGTMNTADRSVGHIDYAIRRRFAFVDVQPNETIIENQKAKNIFKYLDLLFKEHLAPDFKKDDVMIGHSYFLVQDDNQLRMKLDYEIKPILKEYLKDGILLDSAEVHIDNLKV
nr:AAA family ATPase [Acinetobacter indicus]